jgi:hypothetical protein
MGAAPGDIRWRDEDVLIEGLTPALGGLSDENVPDRDRSQDVQWLM